MLSCFSIREIRPRFVGAILLWTWMTKVTHLMMDDLMSFDFSDLSHIWCHTRAYFLFRSRFVDAHWFAWSSPIMRYASVWWFNFALSWLSDGPFLESFIKAHTFWYCCDFWMGSSQRMDSHIIISVGYMSDLLYTPMELFLSYQDRPDTSDAILGHISLILL